MCNIPNFNIKTKVRSRKIDVDIKLIDCRSIRPPFIGRRWSIHSLVLLDARNDGLSVG